MSGATARRDALPAGTELMGYRIEAVLGAGGFGITYLAAELCADQRVALKEYLPSEVAERTPDGRVVPIAPERSEDYRRGVELFAREARTLTRFGHPHVVPVLGCFDANDTAYMVMEYAHGESLGRLLKRVHALPEERLREILMPLLDGLHAVHEAGFLHGDLKPSNVFLREHGGPMLIDFGSARSTAPGGTAHPALATPGYSPPEQYSSAGRVGPWSDIYALAAVAYRAVTGEHPPAAPTRGRRDSVRAALAAARSIYSTQLLRCIGWGLELRPARRPQSVDEWRSGLEGGRVPYVLGPEPAVRGVPTRRRDAIAPYRWAVPIVIALAVIAWRAYDGHNDAGVARPPASRLQPIGQHAVQRHGTNAAPRLVEAVRERPTRDRTGRPGRER